MNFFVHPVDGQNPAPVNMRNAPRQSCSVLAFYPCQLAKDFVPTVGGQDVTELPCFHCTNPFGHPIMELSIYQIYPNLISTINRDLGQFDVSSPFFGIPGS